MGIASLPTLFTVLLCHRHRFRHILRTVKNIKGAKSELAFTRRQNNLKAVRNLTVQNQLQHIISKKRTYTLRINQSRSKASKHVLFSSLRVFTRCRFQSVPVRIPFSKSIAFQNLPAKNLPFSCEHTPIRHIFHRFQDVPGSCERSLSCTSKLLKLARLFCF